MENNTTLTTNMLRPAIFEEPIQTVLNVLFLVISITGTVANLFVLLLIIKTKQLHTPLNFLLMNLSIADLIGGLGIYPYIFIDVSRTTIRGSAADVLCSFSSGLIVFFICSGESVLTLCAISFSRFLSMKFPMRNGLKLTKSASVYFIIVSWIASIVLLVPNGLSFRYENNTGYCYRYYRKGINMKIYSSITTIFGTVLPITMMGLTYFATWRQLWRTNSSQAQETMRGTLRSRKKVMVLLGLLIATYITCWSPFYVYWTMVPLLKYYPDTPEGRIKIFRFYTVAVLFGLCNSTIDPIIYTLRGEQFKRQIRIKFLRSNAVARLDTRTAGSENRS